MTETVGGGCLCGAVTFEIAPPYRWFAHCHCSLCRKHYGTLFGTNLGVATKRFHWLSGARDIVPYRVSDAFARPFCRQCGAKTPALSHEGSTWNVPAGLVTGELHAEPRTHIFVGSKSPLESITDGLPQHTAYPPGIDLRSVAPPATSPSNAAVGGSCLCGGVAFECRAPPRRIIHCYCSRCRRSRGSAFVSTLLIPRKEFSWLRGQERITSYTLPPPHPYRTDFCADCGSPVPMAAATAPFARVPAGAIDTALAPLPGVHTYVGSKARWCAITDTWPQFAELPPRERLAEFLE